MPSPRTKPSLTSLVAFGVILLAGYILSPGPALALAFALSEEGDFPPDELMLFYEVVYWPIDWCCDNAEWVETFYDWYLELWFG